MTWCVVEPSSARSMAPRPLTPMTIRPTFCSRANVVMALHGVPTTAQLRKYAAGRSRKTLVFARVVEDNGVSVLDLREAGA